MQPYIIQDILRRREGLTVEFKQAKSELPKSLFETVCAFLNREGGIILLGVLSRKGPTKGGKCVVLSKKNKR